MLVSDSNVVIYECRNALSARRDPEAVNLLLEDEIKKGFIYGPFKKPPFHSYRVSPIGIATHKYSFKKRLILNLFSPHNNEDHILDLSSPHNNEDHLSINELIDKDLCSLSYIKLGDAIRVIQEFGPNSICCKVDISDAFKQLPISPKQWHLFCF